MSKLLYKVLITASGTGSRLGELTKNTNKALVPINGRETISYILDSYPPEIPLVVTLGYLSESVKKFLTTKYPDRIFEFVTVDKFVGDGSSLLYSMRCARPNLECPFIFHACDTIILEPVPTPTRDWVAGYVIDPAKIDAGQYRSHIVEDDNIVNVQDKGAPTFHSIHIGMIGVQDYERFWETVEELYQREPTNQALGDVPVIECMIKKGIKWKWVPFKIWLDTGNPQALKETETYLSSQSEK